MADQATKADTPALEVADPRIGAVIDKYAVVRLLGSGGMGRVYEARHATLSRRFAMKFLRPELAADREMLARFEAEAKVAGALQHPNLVAVTDLGRAPDGAPFLVMEFLEGEDCAQLLRRLGSLPVTRAASIVAQACRGLALAHSVGIVHRDLKPGNLFLTDAGDGSDLVKVLDFGIAKLRLYAASVSTATGALLGTAHYMSPEQARGAAEVDVRSDVWSMGVVLYELLSGRKPFAGDGLLDVIYQILTHPPPPLGDLRADLPPALARVVERAMAKEPAARWPTVAALGEEIAPFAAPRPVRRGSVEETAAAPATASAIPLPRRSRVHLLATPVLAIAAITVVVMLKTYWPEKEGVRPTPSRSSPAPRKDSCRGLAERAGGAPSGVYTVSDGVMSYPAYCEMTLDGGGWTAFFVGKNGSPHALGSNHHDLETGDRCPAPATDCARRIPAFVTSDFEFAAVCGRAAVKFRVTTAAVDFFKTGVQASWQPLRDVAPLSQPNVFGSSGVMFTGQSRENRAFILVAASLESILTLKEDSWIRLTFASTNYSVGWDYCNGQRDTQSTVMLLYR